MGLWEKFPAVLRLSKNYKIQAVQIFAGGELDGGRSPASNEMNSRQSHAEHGFGERSDFFREYTLSQKNRRFKTVKNTFLTVLGLWEKFPAVLFCDYFTRPLEK